MEDAHDFQHDFDNVPGQGYFAIFDGHAGKFAAEWCRDNMSEILSEELKTSPDMDVREVMKNVFLKADDQLETESAKAGSKRITEKGGFLLNNRVNGDFSMKEFVLWDVVSDQDAVDFVSKIAEPQQAASSLLKHALEKFSTDNTSIMIVRFNQTPKEP
ncbi:protein-serine/threonine phosphatase [Malassezia caprae]|uniref:Protein-serine/threonine phosphatase n=1 Tax=Malassezia caprae TaxID=1381934 RepID=A0AAF0IUA2_9BASI|nr:protein-serine/threonine phosphatase [Malassezia caprae]